MVAVPLVTSAQVDGPRVVARDSGATIQQVGTGAYVIIHEPAMLYWPSGAVDWPHGNTGVVVGSDGVLVVDSDFYPSRAAADIALIGKVTDRPIRWLVNTHWHGDHTHGNGVYRARFPRLVILGARPNARFIGLNQARFPKSVVADGSAQRATLAQREAVLAAGADSSGRRFTEDERALLARVVAEEKEQLREFATVEVAPPTVLFDSAYTLNVGGRAVELRNRGRANSPADVTVYLPAERVLFTGDVVVHPVPYAFGSYPGAWASVLRALEALPVRAVVPGHGPVFGDHAYTRRVRELLEAVSARVEPLVVQGRTLAEVQRAVDLGDLRAKFVKDGDATAAEYWATSVRRALVERTYECLTGSKC
jgi:glyoxylase-like metal-dependent hydrolase (beta-lactamase superfamily II)